MWEAFNSLYVVATIVFWANFMNEQTEKPFLENFYSKSKKLIL